MLQKPVESCEACALGLSGPCLFRLRKVAAGSTLAHQGEVSREVLFVKDGVMGLGANDASGDEVLACVRGPRSVLGLEALAGRPSPFTVTVLADAAVCAASAHVVKAATGLEAAPKTLASAFLGLVLDEHDAAMRDAHLRAGSAASRVAKFLVGYSRLMAPGRAAAFSKTHVAALLGIRPETLSRSLRHFAELQLIGADRLEVLDAVGLAEIGRGAKALTPDER